MSRVFPRILPVFIFIQFILLTGFFVSAQPPYLTERPEWAGYWLNVYGAEPTQEQLGDLAGALTGLTNKPRWREMEQADGDYSNMYNAIGKRIEDAYNNNEYYYCELWLGHLGVPNWIFSAPHNVPEPIPGYPDYTDPTYLALSARFYDQLAAYIASLPQEWIDRIAFIQPGFGSTGDRQLYKDDNNFISTEDYVSVMQTQTIAFISAFQSHPETQNIRFLWNIDNYDGTDPGQLLGFTGQRRGEMLYAAWLRNETGQGQLRKQQFTIAIGYQVPNELSGDNAQRGDFFGTSGRWGGNPEFVRGEFNDQKFNELPLGLVNPGLNYYWTAISSVDRGLDAWEGKLNHWNFLKANYPSHKPAMVEAAAFSSRYSYRKNPATSPYAFIALRDGLDYNDDRFSGYGISDSEKVSAILAEFAPYGAKNDDNFSAMNRAGNGYLENATGLNDCVRNIISRNYSRFITQIDANETSAGYWRVGLNDQGEGHHYGRFARGFDVEKDKNTMYFDVDDEFFEANRAEEGDQTITIKVIYYASDEGSWELKYHAQDGTMKTALSVTNSGSGWQTAEVTVNDALLDNGDPVKGADLVLENTGGTNLRFHMIELERDPDGKMIEVSDVLIENCPSSPLALGVNHQLSATVLPLDATDKSVSWTSSNPGVATVDDSGLVSVLAEGTTEIKVITDNGELVDSCTIAVKTDINILFIGNSFTFRHDLNLLVEEVFNEGSPNLNIYTERQVHGGQSLFQHTEYYFTQSFIEQSTLTDSDIEERIQIMEDFLLLDEAPPEFIHFWENVVGEPAREFPKNVIENAIARHEALLENNPGTEWDYVVLQSWRDEIDDLDDGYAKYAKILGNIANEQGAEVILYITAPDVQNQAPVTEPLMQEKVEQELRTIVDLAREIDPYAVVHVPFAINLIQQEGTDLTFRYENDFHPNQRTAYLTSNMFYSAFFGESTEGFNYDTVTETKTTSSGDELLDPDGGPATVVFEGEEKIYLQKMAFKATSLFNQLWKGTVSVTGVSIENEPVDGIAVGTTLQLNKKIIPFYASDQSVSWSSSDTLIAEVDSTGLVSALDPGYVTITVTTNDGGFKDSYTLLVTAQAVQRPYLGIKQLIPGIVECEWYDEGGQGISFYDVDESRLTNFRYPDEVDIRWRTQASQNRFVGLTVEGEWLEYTVDVTPGDYDIMLYYFCQVDNSTEIEISLDGEKIATFTGMTNKGNLDIQDSVIVRGVSLAGGNDQILRLEFAVGGDVEVDAIVFTPAAEYVAVTGVEMNNCPSAFLEEGETHQLFASITPEDATDTRVIWSSSHPSIATVDENGLVTAVSEGDAEIQVSTTDGDFTDQCVINVQKAVIPVTGISINDCPADDLEEGETHQLSADITPEDATDTSVSWSSSHPSIATVDENGLVTAVSEGEAEIQVSTTDGDFTDQCVINVQKAVIPVTGISINDCPADDLEIGETHQLSAGITPEDATDASVSWSSSQPSIATVDASGKVTALSEGNVTITATSNDGDFSDYCDIIIIELQTDIQSIEMESDLVNVYPNPVQDVLYISFKKPQTETTIYIYNTLGALLYSNIVNASSHKIDVSKYTKESMLLVQVVSNEFTGLHKVILTE